MVIKKDSLIIKVRLLTRVYGSMRELCEEVMDELVSYVRG